MSREINNYLERIREESKLSEEVRITKLIERIECNLTEDGLCMLAPEDKKYLLWLLKTVLGSLDELNL